MKIKRAISRKFYQASCGIERIGEKMCKESSVFGEDVVVLFQGVCDKNGKLWIRFPDMSVATSADKKFWFDMETQYIESLANDSTLDEENRLAVQQKRELIRKGLELMDEKGLG